MNELEVFEQKHCKPLQVGMAVTIDKKHEYFKDWQGQYLVLGIKFVKSHLLYGGGYMNVTIGDNWDDSGCDGWNPTDLFPSDKFGGLHGSWLSTG